MKAPRNMGATSGPIIFKTHCKTLCFVLYNFLRPVYNFLKLRLHSRYHAETRVMSFCLPPQHFSTNDQYLSNVCVQQTFIR